MTATAVAPGNGSGHPRIRPPLKWAGGKFRVLGEILPRLPEGARLIEPFVGSGAVFLNADYPRFHLNDANPDLFNFYRVLKREPAHFIERAAKLFNDRNNSPARYYALREDFNGATDPEDRSAIFLYLNRHSYNGLCRYNASGRFNVPFGRHVRPYFPRRELEACAEKLKRAKIENRDFEPVMREARAGDVVYCDPPYVPLSDTSNFTAYNARAFGVAEQKRLARVAEDLAERGVPVLVSNHATDVTRQLYEPAKRYEFSVRRFISCNGQRRVKTDEVLALFT